jgi:hypothetical protein
MKPLNELSLDINNYLESERPSRNWWDQLLITVLVYHKSVKGTRVGFVGIDISGLHVQVPGWIVHRFSSGVYWVQPPSFFQFTNKAAANRVSDRVMRQLADRYPEDFADFDQGELL